MKNAPRKAIVLAAGFGSRMRPLSHECPKPLMPLWNKPLLEHALDLLISWGVSDILINLHHAPEAILHFCQTITNKSCRIQLSFEPEILGTGGAVRRAKWFCCDEPFWMLNTDIAAELSPAPLIKSFYSQNALATLWMQPELGPRTVELDHEKVKNFASKNPGSTGTATFCGLQLIAPRIFDYFPKNKKFFSIIDAYREGMRRGETVSGICIKNSFWADLGTRERYLNAHRDILQARRKNLPGKSLLPTKMLKDCQARIPADCQTSGFTVVAPGVTIGKGCRLHNTVIWGGTNLSNDAFIENSIAGSNLNLRGTVTNSMVTNCSHIMDDILQQAMRRLRSTPPKTILAALPARGSNRSFSRLQTPRTSAILIRYNPEARPENAVYANHTKFLIKHGIRVPRLLLDMPDKNATLFEDAGTLDLTYAVKAMPHKQITATYKKVINQLIKMHAIPAKALRDQNLEPPFSPELYTWEHSLFISNFLQGQLHLRSNETDKIATELSGLIPVLQKQPQVLLHRDMQSSNILLPHGRPTIIDFQGMRCGPAMYDIASLLCDPYVDLTDRIRQELLDYYIKKSGAGNAVAASFRPAAIQRICQALGAFARLAKLPDMQHFQNFIPPACRTLHSTLHTQTGLPTLQKLLKTSFK